MAQTVLKTPLHDAHIRAGGRMVEFAGYDMPVQYASIIAESKAVRTHAGMFDVSHMARLRLTGERTLEFLEWVTANDVATLGDNRGQYSMLPNERGGVVDDIIVYHIHDDEYAMVVNAANHEKDVNWLNSQNKFGVKIEDLTDESAMIAVQGPHAVELLAEHSDSYEALKNAPAFGVVNCTIGDVAHCFAARSGYTGEDGYEIICAANQGEALWNALLDMGVMPCGLGSRDTLRVEAGLPLYGHELTDDMNPIAAGLGWVLGKTKTFIGSKFINEARKNGTSHKLLGIKFGTKRVAVPGSAVTVEGVKVGEISSGVYSPTLDCGIAFAYINSAIALGTPCAVDFRGKPEPGEIVGKRFLRQPK
ncbi:MAG: glycine cleavage system aminomethyltransferase GcvT [Armatimonadetes bacterium]|nr:glycine cleavage system aminomethyltransferase GcvT [Armatimonadota bacterium]